MVILIIMEYFAVHLITNYGGKKEMKKIILIFLITMSANAWEVTTHRAIDKQALKVVGEQNLKAFIDSVQISNEDYRRMRCIH